MKRTLISLLLAGVLLGGLTACGASPPEADAPFTVAAATYPVYLFATAVTRGVEDVQVELIVNQQTSCLHDYTLSIHDMRIIDRADVLVLNGAGLEDFMADALAASGAPVIDCSQNVDLLPYEGHEDHDHGYDGHDEDHFDPHLWLSTQAAAAMLQTIASELSALDSGHAGAYLENCRDALSRLPQPPPELTGLERPYLITFHDGFQYLAAETGLTILKAIEEEEGSTASAKDIREILSLIEEYQLPAIFVETNGSDATARAIARETGVAVYTLDMIMSGDGTGIQPYLDAMNANYDAIAQALGG